MAEGKARLYQTGLNEHFFHHKPDTRQIPRVCGSFARTSAMSRKRRKIKRGERRHKTHKQAITMYDKNYHRSLSYGVLQKERETEGNNLAERTHGWFRFLNQGAQADRSRFLWSRRRRSSNCKLYINRK